MISFHTLFLLLFLPQAISSANQSSMPPLIQTLNHEVSALSIYPGDEEIHMLESRKRVNPVRERCSLTTIDGGIKPPSIRNYLYNRKQSVAFSNGVNSTYRAAIQRLNKKRSQKARLFVETNPKDARVRILNIRPKFHQGIILRPGRYHIEVSAKGYQMKKMWITIKKGETKTLRVSLKKKPSPSQSAVKKLFRFHTVRSGETLWSISTRYGISLITLMQVNDLDNPNIYIGQKLLIPQKPIVQREVSPEKKLEAEKLLQIGHLYRNRGEYRNAIKFYERALSTNPFFLKAYYSIGYCYLKMDLKKEAMHAFQQAIEIAPYNPEAYYNMGLVYFIVGMKEAATENYEILKILDPLLAERLLSYIKTM